MQTRSGALAAGPSPVQKSRLGRGLASLIGGDNVAINARVLPAFGESRMVPIDRVRPSPLNPRKNFNEAELDELASSIREKGLIQPLVVRPVDATGTSYEIVAGERRWRAAQKASLHLVPVIVRSLSDQEALELAIIENVQRSDLNAIEEAGGYRDLVERFGYTQEELATNHRQEPKPPCKHDAASEAAGQRPDACPRRFAECWARSRSDRARGCGSGRPGHREEGAQRSRRRSDRDGPKAGSQNLLPGGVPRLRRMRIRAPPKKR